MTNQTIRGVLINPVNRTVDEVFIPGIIDGIYSALRTDPQFTSGIAECFGLSSSFDLWIDEEGNLSPGREVWQLKIKGRDGQPLRFAGAAVILCHDDAGESVSCPSSLEAITSIVEWTNLETTGAFGEGREYETDHPILGRVRVFEGGKPIYRERQPQSDQEKE